MKIIVLLNIIVLFISCELLGPDDGNKHSESGKYLQFKKGNYWIYKIYNHTWDGRESTSIIKSIYEGVEEINNQDYYTLVNINSKNDSSYIYYRLDLDNGYLYDYNKSTNSEYFVTILASTPGEYEIDFENYPDSYRKVSIIEETFDLFGENIKILRHVVFDGETRATYIFSEKYGYIQYYFHYINVEKKRSLLGCFINSVAYGDTTFN